MKATLVTLDSSSQDILKDVPHRQRSETIRNALSVWGALAGKVSMLKAAEVLLDHMGPEVVEMCRLLAQVTEEEYERRVSNPQNPH